MLGRSGQDLSRLRTTKLRKMLQDGKDRDSAHRLFDGLLEVGEANSHHLSVMLTYGCGTSSEQQELMARAETSGVELTASCFNSLLGQLQTEGKPLEPVLAEMRSRGVEANAQTQKVLSRSAEDLNRYRTTDLQKMP